MTDTQLLSLPQHILTIIFKFLCFQDIHNFILTCRTFHNIVLNDNCLWRYLAESHQGLKRKRLVPISKEIEGCHRVSWYNICRTSYNWSYGYFKNKIILQHRWNYMPWIRLMDSKQLLVTVGIKLQCYDVKDTIDCKKLLWTLYPPDVTKHHIRTNDISRFVLNGNILACGNRDGSTAVYKVNNIRSKPRLLYYVRDCHDEGSVEVSAVEVLNTPEDSYVLTGSIDSDHVQFWHQDRESDCGYKNYRNIMLEDMYGVRSMTLDKIGQKLAIGPDADDKPLLYDVETGRSMLVPRGEHLSTRKAVRDVQWHDHNLLVYVTHAGGLKVLDTRTDRLAYSTTDPFCSTLYCVRSDGRRALVAGSSEYSRCVLYDIRKPTHVQMYYTQERSSPVYSLDFNSSTLVAAVDRGIAALNFDLPIRELRQKDYSQVFQKS